MKPSKLKVAYNSNFGGWGLSENVLKYLVEKKAISEEDIDNPFVFYEDKDRHNKILIEALELYADENPDIEIIEIPGNTYFITEYDGMEDVIYPGHPDFIVVEDEED